MKRGLLFAAFLATLILDMGGGPVFIVFASLNLTKSATFPAATWLLVRGILNCVQFITVMILVYAVNRVKRQYSRKEEWIIVTNLLATNPIAYFYYLMIIGGLIWNALGSGWVGIAFSDYKKTFGACYLVCIVLSWVSTILSPTFVFCGGLLYSPIKKEDTIQYHEGSVITSLVGNDEQYVDVNKLIGKFNNGRTLISVDDIIWRDNYMRQNQSIDTTAVDVKRIEPISVPAATIEKEEEVNAPPEEETASNGDGIIVIHRDIYDEEYVPVREVRQSETSTEAIPVAKEASNPASLTSIVSVSLESLQRSVAETTASSPPVSSTLNEKEHSEAPEAPEAPSQSSAETPLLSVNSSREPRRGNYSRHDVRRVKSSIVVPDKVIQDKKPEEDVVNCLGIPFVDSAEYVDLSERMKQQINNGEFPQNSCNQNMYVKYLG